MLTRRLFAQRALAGGIGLIAATSLTLSRTASASDATIGTNDHIHIEPPHDPKQPIVHDIDIASYFPSGTCFAAGSLSFTMMPTGDWNFSGQLHDGAFYEMQKRFIDFDAYAALTICIGVKDSLGTAVAFTQTGKLVFGTPYAFNKSGNSKIIKESWKYFVDKHSWYGSASQEMKAVHPKTGGGSNVGNDIEKGADVAGKVITILGTALSFL